MGFWLGVVGFCVGRSVSGAIVSGSVMGGDGGLEPTRSSRSESIINKIADAVMSFYIIKQINVLLVLVIVLVLVLMCQWKEKALLSIINTHTCCTFYGIVWRLPCTGCSTV